jgi:hypothetical protein
VSTSAPCIRPLTQALNGVPTLPREGVQLFVVIREGSFSGRTFGAGEVLVCRGEARSGDQTVLVARGHGRPRLGSVRGTRLVGDAGEPCLAERWQAAGRLVACYRHAAHGWVVELFERESEGELERQLEALRSRVDSRASEAAAVARGAPSSPNLQLSLFAA